MEMPTFKCILVGDGNVGKSAFVQKQLTGEFQPNYIPTLGVEVHSLVFKTTAGFIRFNVWDTAGQERYGGLGDGYYIQAHCAIVMFDLTNQTSYDHVPTWYHNVINVVKQHIPTILVGSKADLYRVVQPDMINFHREVGVLYYDISSRSNFQIEKPFGALTKSLLGDNSVTLLEY